MTTRLSPKKIMSRSRYVPHKIIFFTLLVAGWQSATMSGAIPGNILPSPVEVVGDLWYGIEQGTLVHGLATSMWRLAAGLALAIAGGVVLGVIMARYEVANQTAGSLVLGLQSIPSIAWVPLGILWFGLTDAGIIFVIVIGAMFAITINTQAGIRNISPDIIRAAENMGAGSGGSLRMTIHVLLPAAVPYLIAGLRQGWAFAWRGVIGAELLFSYLGLGYMLYVGRSLNDISQVFAVMLVIMIVGLAVDALLFGRLEGEMRRRWRLEK